MKIEIIKSGTISPEDTATILLINSETAANTLVVEVTMPERKLASDQVEVIYKSQVLEKLLELNKKIMSLTGPLKMTNRHDDQLSATYVASLEPERQEEPPKVQEEAPAPSRPKRRTRRQKPEPKEKA